MTQPPEHQQNTETLAHARFAAQRGRLNDAAAAFRRYLAGAPGDAAVVHEAAGVLRQLGDTAGIEAIFKAAIDSSPDEPILQLSYIEAVLNQQRPQEALSLVEEALGEHGGHSGFHALKGLILQTLGQESGAKAAFWAALEADPNNMHALFNLAPLESGDGHARILAAVDAAWARRQDLPVMDQIALGFARGRVCERAGRLIEAFDSYAEGAKLKRKMLNYQEAADVGLQDRHMQLFTKTRLEKAALPADVGSDLVFIVSLPRSGSTLIEQILASHPEAAGLGERDFMMKTFDTWYAGGQGNLDSLFSEAALRAAGQNYMAMARAAAGEGSRVIVDKTLGNYAYLGFIQCLFPGAKIIHAVRDPMDTALSCFTTLFYYGLEWTYDLGELGRAVRRYQKFMGFWQRVLSVQLHHARYEDLLADPEAQVRKLLDFCGLQWDPACLAFHKTERAVATASVTQVRQPLYKTAQGRAAKFSRQLEPLARAMGRASDPDWYLK